MEKTRQYHRGQQFNDLRLSIGMPWPILSKQSGIPEAELLILKDQEQIDDERFARIAAGLGTDLETLKSYRPSGSSVYIDEMKDNTNSPVGARQEFSNTDFTTQEFHENSNPTIHHMDKELLAKLEAKHEALHESERARIKLLEEKIALQDEKIALLEERNALQEEVIRMLRGEGK